MDGEIVFTADQTFDVQDGTLTEKGIVQLSDSVTTDSDTLAATAGAVASTYTLADTAYNTANTAQSTATAAKTTADAALPKAGGSMDGEIVFTADQTFNVQDGTLTEKGIVQLSDAIDSDSTTLAATANAVNNAYERGTSAIQTSADAKTTAEDAQTTADAALPKSGGEMTGIITFDADQTFPSTITANYMPLSGGNFTGGVTFLTDKAEVTAAGTIKGYSGEFRAAVLVDTGDNVSGIIPLFRGVSANTNKFIIEADGTARFGVDLDMATADGGDQVTITTDGDINAIGKISSATTEDTDGNDVLTTKGYVLSKLSNAGGGSVTEVATGDGLTGGPITETGTISVLADGDTITVIADGIKVD